MDIIISPTQRVDLESTTTFYKKRALFIQYRPMIQKADGTWKVDQSVVNPTVEALVSGADVDTFENKSKADQKAFIGAFLLAKVPIADPLAKSEEEKVADYINATALSPTLKSALLTQITSSILGA